METIRTAEGVPKEGEAKMVSFVKDCERGLRGLVEDLGRRHGVDEGTAAALVVTTVEAKFGPELDANSILKAWCILACMD